MDDYTFDNLVVEKGNGASKDTTEQYETFVKNNKHNQVTSTYYLLLKKRERKTGRNYLFELVTSKKRTGVSGQAKEGSFTANIANAQQFMSKTITSNNFMQAGKVSLADGDQREIKVSSP